MRTKLFTAAAIMALVVPSVVQAQTSATVVASATVQASLSASATNGLNFGTLAMGDDETVSSSGPGALSAAGVKGRGQVNVQHNSKVSVTALVPSVLTNGATGNTLGFVATCAIAATSGGAGTAVPNCVSFDFTPTTLGTVQNTFILVGGTVTGDAAAGIGTFSGDVVFTVASTN
jgi:hypothetical protein